MLVLETKPCFSSRIMKSPSAKECARARVCVAWPAQLLTYVRGGMGGGIGRVRARG